MVKFFAFRALNFTPVFRAFRATIQKQGIPYDAGCGIMGELYVLLAKSARHGV
jgi:hypothetical protein